jgi:aminodeoxyfutalosine deaminase
VDDLGVERVGHGVSAGKDRELLRRLAKDQVALEVCLSSNLQTGAVADLDSHPLRRFLDAGIPVTLATDNPTVSATNLTEEYLLAIDRYDLTEEEVLALIRTGQRTSFVT